jgi:chromate transporter
VKGKAGLVGEIFRVFLKLGLTSFGGPVAHLAFFRAEFVQRRAWLGEKAFADLVALCQFLPGPASSQAGFAIGYLRAGVAGAIAAWIAFTLPSALLMLAFAAGFAHFSPAGGGIHGLQVAAFAVVAQAVGKMARYLCPDLPRIGFAAGGLLAALLLTGPWIQPAVVLLGFLGGAAVLGRRNASPVAPPAPVSPSRLSKVCLALLPALLILLPWLAIRTESRAVDVAAALFRIGSLVFGGGHVVLPLLQSEITAHHWLSPDEFLAGYGAAQALPGPLFSIAAFIGARTFPDGPGWLAGFGCLIAIFAPSFLLLLGVLPHWERLRARPRLQGALAGANAAVVGLLAAALIHPLAGEALTSPRSALLAAAAWVALVWVKAPPWLIVLGCFAVGMLALRG